MPEIPTPVIVLGVPVIGQFQFRRAGFPGAVGIARGCQKDKREAASLDILASGFNKSELVAVEIKRRVQVGHPDHGMKITHGTLRQWRKTMATSIG